MRSTTRVDEDAGDPGQPIALKPQLVDVVLDD
jgi:hypothetical protein